MTMLMVMTMTMMTVMMIITVTMVMLITTMHYGIRAMGAMSLRIS